MVSGSMALRLGIAKEACSNRIFIANPLLPVNTVESFFIKKYIITMKAIELAKAYDPKSFEDRIYALWKEKGAFKPEACETNGSAPAVSGKAKKPFVIVIPPPNVTGVLHLGHGLNNSLQDILVRYHRMAGDSTLWVPGTDHAGIATQHVVERRLKQQGKSRHDLGREKFIEETWKVKHEHHAIISKQLARIGASVDWDRERFTMDEGLSRAVRNVFVTLYERDLLYKGNYLVNWCITCGTALSDDEVDHEECSAKMYKLRYYFAGSDTEYIEVATTRPETMLGDTAVAVHPEDERYAKYKGKNLLLPLAGREIPLVFDAYVDRAFGTGAVKITPAHDPNDWELAKRHNLPVINILNADGTLNSEVPEKYRGMKVSAARTAVLEDLTAGSWFVSEDKIKHSVGHCYRCNTVIEPFLSKQWFVKMKPLADKALASWKRGELIFYPKKWENTYQHWMENIRDWCVSRQLWWGHRIPAWECADCGKISVSRNDISVCPHCGSAKIEQDPDVLDTWFSSWLWPFSTLGWESDMGFRVQGSGFIVRENVELSTRSDCEQKFQDGIAVTPNPKPQTLNPNSDFNRYYPTSALVTAYDIIFFWVSRMIMAGLEFTGKAPFHDIYIHGLVRDKQGRKMSKSLGNGLDPLELVDEFGADAMKFTLAFMCAQGQDILVDKESFKMGSKFANKVWNASRYILMNLDNRELIEKPALLPVDKWIYTRLNKAALAMKEAFNSYRFNDAAITAYEYFWNDFCDWYVEATKLSLKDETGNIPDAEKDRAATVLLNILRESLRLLHPLLPFVSEEIYGKLPNVPEGELLITSPYPEYTDINNYADEEKLFAFLQELVRTIRTMRSECTVPPDKKLKARVCLSSEYEEIFRKNEMLVKQLAGISEMELSSVSKGSVLESKKPVGTVGLIGNGFEVFMFIADAVDTKILKQKFAKDLEKDQKYIQALRIKLENEQFTANAPPELVSAEKLKMEEALKRSGKIESYLRDL